MSDWIEWEGGERPVSGDAHVEVVLRDGTSSKWEARWFTWSHNNSMIEPRYQIVKYRLVSSAAKVPPTEAAEEQHRKQWAERSLLVKFDSEISTITQRRGEVYGHPADDFAIAADLMKHFDHIESLPLRHSLRMICVKLARLTTTPDHLDSYVDIVGYSRTAVMILEREKANG